MRVLLVLGALILIALGATWAVLALGEGTALVHFSVHGVEFQTSGCFALFAGFFWIFLRGFKFLALAISSTICFAALVSILAITREPTHDDLVAKGSVQYDLRKAEAVGDPNASPATLLAEAKEAERAGHIEVAAPLYRTLADNGNAEAARRLGMIYDPTDRAVDHANRLQANALYAYSWYTKAILMGDTEAAQRLTQLIAWAKGAASRGDMDAQRLVDRAG